MAAVMASDGSKIQRNRDHSLSSTPNKIIMKKNSLPAQKFIFHEL